MNKLRLGTRGSKLALWQANSVAEKLKHVLPDIDIHIKTIKTRGDEILDVALSKIGDKGLFTGAIESELLEGTIDVAVHSLKDLPSKLQEGLQVGAVLKREIPLDALLSFHGYTFDTLPDKAVVGTSSLRRTAQIKMKRPDITIEPIRGNIDTRIKKMKDQNLHGIFLAAAGVKRLGFDKLITDVLSPDIMLPAVGQGTIALEVRASDTATGNIIRKVDDRSTRVATSAERAFLHKIQGGCQVPIACMCLCRQQRIKIQGLVASLDGQEVYAASMDGDDKDAVELGVKLAEKLLSQGAEKLLSKLLAEC